MAIRSTSSAANGSAPSYVGPFIIVTTLFGIIGFLTSLNNVLVKKLEDTFQLTHGPAMLATAAWFLAYLVFSIPASKVIEAVGYKRTIVISLLIMTGGALLFLPAANMVSFHMTLFAIFVLATGVCGLQTSANPYVSILGPERSAAARLTLAQAFNSIGSLAAPWIAGIFILSSATTPVDAKATAHMLQGPYIAIAAALLLLSFAVALLRLPAITATRDFRPSDVASGRSIWTYSHTVLGMFGILFYAGTEISLVAITIQFCLSQGMTKVETASLMVSLFYLGMMVGRLLGSLVMVWIKAEKLLVLLGALGVALLLTAMFTHGNVAIACLVLTGIANSVMYPNIFALGIAELGPMTSKGSGVITIGNVGGAIVPPLFGLLADKTSIQVAFIIPIIGYLFVAYYGLIGYKPSRDVKA
jgi:MFS transporter, FHS family, L-fucose permease